MTRHLVGFFAGFAVMFMIAGNEMTKYSKDRDVHLLQTTETSFYLGCLQGWEFALPLEYRPPKHEALCSEQAYEEMEKLKKQWKID